MNKKNDLNRILRIASITIPILIIALIILTLYPAIKPYLSNELDWRTTKIYSPDEEPSSPFSYVGLMKYDNKLYEDEQGKKHAIPQRLIFRSHSELYDTQQDELIKYNKNSVSIPSEDMTMDLRVPNIQSYFHQLCEEYSTGSKSFSTAEIHFTIIQQQDGDPIYVVAKLMDDYAFRSVWSVDSTGSPTPIAFNATNDRNGYKYRDNFTRQEILFKDLYLPPK